MFAVMMISVLIPCHNEEKSIEKCIESCFRQSRPPDQIVVVNDGSTDKSREILRKFKNRIKVIDIYPATGNKSYAQEEGLKYIKGDIFVSTDGDTIFDRNFFMKIEADFLDPTVVAVGGYVRSIKFNWLTAARAFDYVIGQNIHKLAQSFLNFLLVIPGAAGAFRTKIFKKYIGFDHDTITEDLDFTYKLHEQGFKIKYNRKAVVYTQDPPNLNSYINQMRRWYSGGWQNLIKHLSNNLISKPGTALELSLIYIEGLVFSVMFFLVPLVNISLAFKIFLILELIIIGQVIYAALIEKRPDFLVVPLYYPLLMAINSYIFLEQFFREVVLRRKNLIWFHPERIKL